MLPQKKCLRTSELQKQVVAMEMQRASDAVTIFELSSRLNEPGSRMASCTSAALTVMTGKPFNTREGNERQSWKPSRGGTLEQLTPRPPPLHYRLSCRLHESPARLCWPAAAQAMQSEAAPGRQMCCRGQQTGFGRPADACNVVDSEPLGSASAIMELHRTFFARICPNPNTPTPR